MALIEVRDLVMRYDGRTVLNGVNLDVEEGRVKVVMGQSGCGKSTLMRCLNRLTEPTSGSIRFRGKEVTGPGVDLRALRQQIGFVFQHFSLYRHLTVLDNVTLALRKLRGMKRAEAEARALRELERLDVASHAGKYPGQISGGQKQRVAVARALAMDPSVLFLDEPTSALDPALTREVIALINTLYTDNVTMLVVTHDTTLARWISDEIVFMDGGRVHATGSMKDLRQSDDPQLRAFFGPEGRGR